MHPQIALADPPLPDEASARMTDRIEVLTTRYSEEKERRQLGALKPALGVGPKE